MSTRLIARIVKLARLVSIPAGLAFLAAFYWAMLAGPLDSPVLRSLFVEHPVEWAAAAMFFVGIASLVAKLVQVCCYSYLNRVIEFSLPSEISPTNITGFRSVLERLRTELGYHPWLNRLERLSAYLSKADSLDAVYEFADRLAAEDQSHADGSYGAVRMYIWAIPILGFLGTVIGIAMALGKLSPQDLEQSLPAVMSALTVAFNTTIVALALCLLLYFALFGVQRLEAWFLTTLDQKTEAIVANRLVWQPKRADGAPLAVVEDAVKLQLKLWEQLVLSLQQAVQQKFETVAEKLVSTADQAVARAVKAEIEAVHSFQRDLAVQFERHVQNLKKSLGDELQLMAASAARIGDVLQSLEAIATKAGAVERLQATLQQNLETLATVGKFEELVSTLAATIQLLTAKTTGVASNGGRTGISLAGPPNGQTREPKAA